MARPKPAPQKNALRYAGDEVFAEQIAKLEIPETVEGVKRRIHEAVESRRVVSPTTLLGEVVGPEKNEEEHPEDPETVQAFALNFLALWNEAAAELPAEEAVEAWRAEVQGLIQSEAKEAMKPYVAPPKPGRNDPCPCGSGKKYKRCCGA
ncbi:MAG TPA: SEC-C metal-binding domain-containing protein [Myxococcales bacterium]|nr:SEC-C metal-binding domain-containing protein [Myxococcales bacterium]